MLEVIGDILPIALGIAISPVPVIAVVLMLLSPRPRASSLSFLAGWSLGIIVAVAVFVALGGLVGGGEREGGTTAAVIQLVLALLLGGLAVRQWKTRPVGDQEPDLPNWMGAIDTMRPLVGTGLGFLLAALNPKNLLMAVAAGAAIGQANVGFASTVWIVLVFFLVAASTVLVPTVAYLLASEKMASPLDRLRAWLVASNHTIMTVLLAFLAVNLLGKGIANL